MKLPTVVALLLFLSIASAFEGESDQVISLPGLNFPINYRHYSGYLESLNSTYLHYWFFESQSGHSQADPVLVWLNGGPGCSSLFGALTENGPLHIDDMFSSKRSRVLSPNPFSWTAKANVLYLESPAAVGFSYQVGQTNVTTDDVTTAAVNFAALRSFYRKFPHLAGNDFYLTGESYGGFYVPTLAMHVMDNDFPKNFKGIAIGDGLLTWSNQNTGPHFIANYQATRNGNFGTPLEDWINQADVMKALHILPNFTGPWAECSSDVLLSYKSNYQNMSTQLKRIANSGHLKTLIYHGEKDPLIPWKGNKQFLDSLGFQNITAFVPWKYNGSEVGLTEHYQNGLTFTTFHKAGHMVPQDLPAPSYQMINQFLFEN